ncbi:MAG: site-specific integrase [Acidobacteriota bacterium]|nr:site-specific integrase [Acidobacteriota bacterium]
MNLATSTNFIGLRDLTITWLVRETNMPLKMVLELSREDILTDSESALMGENFISNMPLKMVLELSREDILTDSESELMGENVISNMPSFVVSYIHNWDILFPDEEILFPTKDGNRYYPKQFAKRARKLLSDANASVKPYYPKKLSSEQYKKLIDLRFRLQRHRYQMILATALCTYLGCRSAEVAGLKKADIDFSNRVINLVDTKGQEDQESPLLSVLYKPFLNFTERFSHLEHLFVNFDGKPWNRIDVLKAVKRYGRELGIIGLTPRRMRATLGVTLARMKMSPSLLAKTLRHRDPATALRYYNYRKVDEVRYALESFDNMIAENKTKFEGIINEFECFYEQPDSQISF